MPIRNVEFLVSSNDIYPGTIQFAGMQYEHNATVLKFVMDSELYAALPNAAQLTYRIDINNGEDNYYPSGEITPAAENGKTVISYEIPHSITKAGGLCKATLVISALSEGSEVLVYCSAPALIKFESVDRGCEHSVEEETVLLSGIAQEAKGCVIASASVDGNGQLIITYASGATVNAGLVQLPATDENVTNGGTLPVQSGAVYTALQSKQNTLTFDDSPTAGSDNPVKSGGIAAALGNKQNNLTFDSAPTQSSANPVVSGGIYTALQGKQDKLTFDDLPVEGSSNPVKSGGVSTLLDGKQEKLVSGLNIKTVNNQSLLGSGDITTPSVTVDQTYEKISTNPQSGIAVEEGIRSHIVDDPYSYDVTNAMTANAVQVALVNKQNTLVSGTNIKTVNYQSLLGSGNIDIGGGASDPFELIEKIVIGYSVVPTEPADWETNYGDYFLNAGTAQNPNYVANTSTVFTPGEIYSYDPSGFTGFLRRNITPNGINYQFRKLLVFNIGSMNHAGNLAFTVNGDAYGITGGATIPMGRMNNFIYIVENNGNLSIAQASKNVAAVDSTGLAKMGYPIIATTISSVEIANYGSLYSIPSGTEIYIYGVWA